ncbi:MAG: diguanylate cyclase [Candidatus Omnitrophica bacterium]|nr:diguanylate cyclase [Candidatus Omnitrophota bacterium]
MKARIFRRESLIILWVAAIVLSYFSYQERVSFLSILRHKTSDLFFHYRYDHSRMPEAINRLVIVNVDEETMLKIDRSWPLSRRFYGDFINRIYELGGSPAAIGMDLVFAGKGEKPEDDEFLADAFRRAGNVVIASYFNEEGRAILPESSLAESAKAVGFISSPRDRDLVIRRAYPFMSLKDGTEDYSFVIKTFLADRNIGAGQVVHNKYAAVFKLPVFDNSRKAMTVPLDRENRTFRINYLACAGDFKTVPFWKALYSEGPRFFDGKIILVGTDIEINHDVYPTPLGLMPGVVINANILLGLLSDRFLKDVSEPFYMAVLFVIGLMVSAATYRAHNLKGLILVIAITAASFYATAWLMSRDTVLDFLGIVYVSTLSFVSISVFKHVLILVENSRLRKMALTDGLTGLYDFRYFEIKLNSEIKTAQAEDTDLSLVLLDVDHFKGINDTYGHELGNKVLKKVALTIRRHTRRGDTVARFGGDEFAVIVPDSDIAAAGRLAESVRSAMEKIAVSWQGKTINTTLSAGVSSLSRLGKSAAADDLIDSADKALYKAKMAGRNKVFTPDGVDLKT